MTGAWDRGRCPRRVCTANVNNPLPCPGAPAGLQSPFTETKALRSRGTSYGQTRTSRPFRLPSFKQLQGTVLPGAASKPIIYFMYLCVFIYLFM